MDRWSSVAWWKRLAVYLACVLAVLVVHTFSGCTYVDVRVGGDVRLGTADGCEWWGKQLWCDGLHVGDMETTPDGPDSTTARGGRD